MNISHETTSPRESFEKKKNFKTNTGSLKRNIEKALQGSFCIVATGELTWNIKMDCFQHCTVKGSRIKGDSISELHVLKGCNKPV